MKQAIDVTYSSPSGAQEEFERLLEKFAEGVILTYEIKPNLARRISMLHLVVPSEHYAIQVEKTIWGEGKAQICSSRPMPLGI
jgi:hypothetical protein